MPIIKSALKAMRQSQKRRLRNRAAKSSLKTVIKKVRAGIEEGDRNAAEKAFAQAVPSIDKAASKGFIHKNAAARYKSRLARQLHAIPQPS
ncbi:30S ribosomal protein S20 [Candidatus Methylomirabilis lanthanidiphila]|uniref:Small ribosomal subunit protein bS20 n=1 Tax=Candidatus Methylomirabilis lanthanidiphila TaxID=2211376 RepID=A0A564ZF35_9BACT|nr:30S ribosomal protein S20 [Candidatus Methylomirabilis lanthanidiphila]VUZ83949.1 30S ribosomal protein S20 [Candidatus Methylomirabilis lanthanidiphila]